MENNNIRGKTVPYTANSSALNTTTGPTPLFAGAPRQAVSDITTPQPAGGQTSQTPSTNDIIMQSKPPLKMRKLLIRGGSALLVLALIGAGVMLYGVLGNKQDTVASNSLIANTTIPLSEFANSGSLALLGAQSLSVNGQLRANESFILAPQAQPTGASSERGQIYYDNSTDQLAYYNGTQYLPLASETGVVQTLQGQSGDITFVGGNGITIAGTTVTNGGVTSFGGQTGGISVGAGLAMNGGTVQNTGLVSATSGTPSSITVTNDGAGNITINNIGAGTGTVQSPGGTNGRIAMFTGAQTIDNSIISQASTTITVTGNLAVATGGLTLANALTVGNGGTGVQTLTANGVIIGNGASALTSVTAGGSGLCLMSTGGAPSFSACPGSGGVTSLNGLTGVLTLANATGVGSTVTINDATTGAKGIASYNSTNFSVTSGAVNTVQNINTAATPTFTGVNTNTITPSAALTVGATGQTALLQGSTATVTSSGAGNDITLNSADQVIVAAASTIELQSSTNVTGNLDASGTLAIGTANAMTVAANGNITTSGDIAVNGGDVTSTGALNITPGGALVAGATGQTLTLQGNASTTLTATGGGFTTTVGFVGTPTGTVRYNFDRAASAGTYTVCTTAGNCSSGGSGDILQNGNSFAATMTIGTNDANNLAFETSGVTRMTIAANGSDITLASNTSLRLQGATAYISNVQGTTNSEVFGQGANTSADRNVIIGNGATSGSNSDSVAIGYQASTLANSVAIGEESDCSNNGCVTIGWHATAAFGGTSLGTESAATGNASLALGSNAVAGNNNSIALGTQATTTTTNQLVIGATGGAEISHVVIGNGVTHATPLGFLMQGTSGTGSNVAGAGVTIASGQSTGSGAGGNITLQISAPGSAGSSTNALTNVVTVSGSNGAVTAQNATNSTTAFRILSSTTSSSVPQFVVDTTNSRVYIGNPSTDTTGALLVLDSKSDYTNGANSNSEPTGVNGGMYYNSGLGQFRCYDSGYWRDCGTDTARTTYRYVNDFIGDGTDSSVDFFADNGDFGGRPGEVRHPGIVYMDTGTSANSTLWVVPRSPGTEIIRFGGGDYWRSETTLRIPSGSSALSDGTERYSLRTGFLDDGTSNGGNGNDGCFLRYTDNINGGRWQGVCRNNATESVCDTTISVALDSWYRLTVAVNAAGTSADFQVNGTSQCQVTSNIPTAAGRETNWGIDMVKSIGTTARTVDLDYFEATGQFGSAR